jgi:rhodanese-related sulfurtransferase
LVQLGFRRLKGNLALFEVKFHHEFLQTKSMRRFISEALLLLAAILGLAALVWLVCPLEGVSAAAREEGGKVAWAWVQAQGEGEVLLVDARSEAEFAQSHLPHAISLNMDNLQVALPSLLDQYSPDKAVVVYCGGRGCAGARELAQYLREKLEMPHVYTLIGGWEGARK